MAQPNSTDPHKAETGITLKRVGVIMFLIVYCSMLYAIEYLWSSRQRIWKHRRSVSTCHLPLIGYVLTCAQLLLAITASLPFLTMRLLYSIFSAFAPTGIPGVTSGDKNLAAFNSLTGSVGAYLFMSVITEIVVVAICVSAATLLPLNQDYDVDTKEQAAGDGVNLRALAYAPPSYPPPPHSRTSSSTSLTKY